MFSHRSECAEKNNKIIVLFYDDYSLAYLPSSSHDSSASMIFFYFFSRQHSKFHECVFFRFYRKRNLNKAQHCWVPRWVSQEPLQVLTWKECDHNHDLARFCRISWLFPGVFGFSFVSGGGRSVPQWWRQFIVFWWK